MAATVEGAYRIIDQADPASALRREIEEAASNGSRPDLRTARLLEHRAELSALLDLVDTYVGDNASEIGQTPEPVLRLRENADLREQLLARGFASGEELDEAFIYDHETLDDLADRDLLEEVAEHVAEVHEQLVESGFPGTFTERLHPRGRGGKFTDKMGGMDYLQGKVKTPKVPTTGRDAAKAKGARRTAQRKGEQTQTPEAKKATYDKRKADLEGRVAKEVGAASSSGKLSSAESHFNDAGKVSQRTLLMYVGEAASEPSTFDLYSEVDPATGNRVWDESRRAVHERIITAMLKERKVDPATGKFVLDYSPSAPDLQPHPEGPKVLFSGGGYAAGKGSVLKILAAQGKLPEGSFTLDPDQIKAELPEFSARIGTDPEANLHTYQEAWAISQEVQARAVEKKLNIVVDGISNTSPDEMLTRAKSFTDAGYQAQAVYVDIPTEEAIKRAAYRAEKAKDDSDRRMIPEIIMRSVHRDVAATVPSLLHELSRRYSEVPLDVSIWDNDQGQDENGSFRPPKQMVNFEGGNPMEVMDTTLWDRFRAKGHETILHVDAPKPQATP